MKKTVRYLSGRTEMARFDALMKATFNPPRNWTLLEDLKFYSDEITEEDGKEFEKKLINERMCRHIMEKWFRKSIISNFFITYFI